MKNLYTGRLIALFLCSLFFVQKTNGQSTGKIIRQATAVAGRTVLDPNSDTYTSATSAGYNGNDVANSEITFRAVPSFNAEPFGDLRRGPSHLYTDFVPDANNVGYYSYFTGTNLLFRFRMGSVVPGSKGYSVLLDTDGKFGSSGANADPNFQAATTGTNGNPGFEIEIVMETNFRIAIYNVNGSSTPTLIKSYTNWQDMSQVSIAGTFDNGDPDYFLDFYIPFSDLQASPFLLTTSTPLRMSATTVMSPQAAIGGPKSDIYGLNDANYKSTNDQYEAYINAQPAFTAASLTSGTFAPVCTNAPVVNGPITPGVVNITGTWMMSSLEGSIATTTITVYKNGVSSGTISSVNSGATWTLNNVTVANGDVITAKAQSAGESMCLVSNSVIAKSCTPANRPALPVLTCGGNYNKGISGSNLSTGWVVYVENLTRGTVETSTANPAQFTFSGTSPNITWNYAGGCSGGPNMPSGSYRLYYVNASGCQSEPIIFCIATGSGSSNNLAGTAATPVITSPTALTPGTTAISGTGEPNGTARLYVAGELIQTVTSSATGVFNFTNLSLTNGQQVYVTNVLNTGTVSTSKCFASSVISTVNCFTNPPLINVDNNSQLTAGQPITGISSAPAGSTIRVYTSANALVSTTTVQSGGTWTTGAYVAVAGTSYYATAQNGTCTVSTASATFASAAATTGRCGTITGPVTASATSISGTVTGAVAGTTVNIYLDQVKIGSVTTATTSWTINTSSLTYPLYANGVLSIGVQETGKLEQYCVASNTMIACGSSPVTPVISPSSSTITQGQTQTYSISNAVIGNFYGLSDATTGTSLGSGVWATTSTVNISTNTLSQGSYSLAIKSTLLTGVTACVSNPASAALTVNGILPLSLLDFKARINNEKVELTWITEAEKNTDHFDVQRSEDGVNFRSIGKIKTNNSNLRNNYSFEDEQPSLVNYYRLKMVDRDEKFTFSKTLKVQRSVSNLISVQPNPFMNEIVLKADLTSAQQILIRIADVKGQVVYTKAVNAIRGMNTITAGGLNNLRSGMYFVHVTANDGKLILSSKMMKQ